MEERNIPDFKWWFENNLCICRYPMIKEITDGIYKDYDIFINVSDEHWLGYNQLILKNGKLGYWFPMGEIVKDMGLVSIYGSLSVLYEAYQENKKVVLHCQAGRNRSPMIGECLYFMVNGDFLEPTLETILEINCKKGYLPELHKMISFLKYTKEALDNKDKFLGGIYDWILEQSFGDKTALKKK